MTGKDAKVIEFPVDRARDRAAKPSIGAKGNNTATITESWNSIEDFVRGCYDLGVEDIEIRFYRDVQKESEMPQDPKVKWAVYSIEYLAIKDGSPRITRKPGVRFAEVPYTTSHDKGTLPIKTPIKGLEDPTVCALDDIEGMHPFVPKGYEHPEIGIYRQLNEIADYLAAQTFNVTLKKGRGTNAQLMFSLEKYQEKQERKAPNEFIVVI